MTVPLNVDWSWMVYSRANLSIRLSGGEVGEKERKEENGKRPDTKALVSAFRPLIACHAHYQKQWPIIVTSGVSTITRENLTSALCEDLPVVKFSNKCTELQAFCFHGVTVLWFYKERISLSIPFAVFWSNWININCLKLTINIG